MKSEKDFNNEKITNQTGFQQSENTSCDSTCDYYIFSGATSVSEDIDLQIMGLANVGTSCASCIRKCCKN